ncbi:hypothetical protein AB205_0081970 [Aquarana catesbeiana]|uniref:Uncharacterized protein n=1 Tax=Aquarana catesbeiana TaxID=8400 RepID=A0A2G9RRM3_AQUCT|nr:hypothetical protein AB205_0081970 [Aquarana catesbeiana]
MLLPAYTRSDFSSEKDMTAFPTGFRSSLPCIHTVTQKFAEITTVKKAVTYNTTTSRDNEVQYFRACVKLFPRMRRDFARRNFHRRTHFRIGTFPDRKIESMLPIFCWLEFRQQKTSGAYTRLHFPTKNSHRSFAGRNSDRVYTALEFWPTCSRLQSGSCLVAVLSAEGHFIFAVGCGICTALSGCISVFG